jgi:hypothetical protein
MTGIAKSDERIRGPGDAVMLQNQILIHPKATTDYNLNPLVLFARSRWEALQWQAKPPAPITYFPPAGGSWVGSSHAAWRRAAAARYLGSSRASYPALPTTT